MAEVHEKKQATEKLQNYEFSKIYTNNLINHDVKVITPSLLFIYYLTGNCYILLIKLWQVPLYIQCTTNIINKYMALANIISHKNIYYTLPKLCISLDMQNVL